MKDKMKKIFKNLIIAILCTVTVSSAVISSIPTAKSATSILNSNSALGSPILNENFTVDNWNKWEMICWGVFLSNFCQPLIDTYESAFQATGSGSNGTGYRALCFGSGNDNSNNDTIEAFCSYAIQQQQTASLAEVYVTYTNIGNAATIDGTTLITNSKDPNNGDTARLATIADFFFQDGLETDKTSINFEGSNGSGHSVMSKLSWYSQQMMYSASVPTFWIHNKSSDKWIKILDFTDTWDVQVFAAIINSVRDGYEGDFASALDTLIASSTQVSMDVFGNLVLSDRKMLFPAAANQHITKDDSINLLNSWVFNHYNSTYGTDDLVGGLRQEVTTLLKIQVNVISGLPAFTTSNIGSVGLLYYDTDSAVYKDGSNTTIGEVVKSLYKSDINQSTSQTLPLKFEIADMENRIKRSFWGNLTDADRGYVINTSLAASLLSNNSDGSVQPKMLTYIINTDGSEIDLFEDTPVIIPIQLKLSKDSDDAGAVRYFYNYCYRAYIGDITNQSDGGTMYTSQLRNGSSNFFNAGSFSEFKDACEDLWPGFTSAYPDIAKKFRRYAWADMGDNDSITADSDRLVMVYPISDVLRSVSSVLACNDGTEFSTYSTMIYMTYLDWYGVVNQTTLTTGTESTSKFDPEIYDGSLDCLNVDPGSIATMKSQEDLEDEVLNLSFLMLSTESGREYRKKLIYNGITDFVYEQYNRIVYGGSSSSYSGTASKSDSGFFAVETYDSLPITSTIIQYYSEIAVWLIGICIVIAIVMGLLKKKKLSWFFFTILIIINCILIAPSSGEIVPYMTNKMVNNMFTSKMTAWTMSEGITNAQLEADANTSSNTFEGMSDDEAQLAVSLIKKLNVVYTDRSLMLKQDISQKLTQELNGVYSEVQSIASARWLLPMLMEQFTNSNEDETYSNVYVKLSNVWDDASNLYWYFNPDDATNVTKATATSSQFTTTGAVTRVEDIESYDKVSSYFDDFVEPTWADDTSTDFNYANYSYTLNSDLNYVVHTYAWCLPDSSRKVYTRKDSLGSNGDNYENADSWQLYIDNITGSDGTSKKLVKSNFETTNKSTDEDNNYYNAGFEQIADTYDRTDATSLKSGFSFYKMTESPFYYFFDVVKDSFNKDVTTGADASSSSSYTVSLGTVIGKLIGEIQQDEEGNDVRSNFLYATITSDKESEKLSSGRVENNDVQYTGYIRDVLDLQYFFSNVVPYMYQMTLQTGGFDGVSGILGDETITDESDYYEGNMQSWAYRCNWAVKVMENPTFSDPQTVTDADGNTYTVNNPMLVECYPDNRPMVFSEAQMYALGLSERNLNTVELRCVELNKNVARQWTLLVNYANTDGITKEVIFRQMATDATTLFCQEFSSGGFTNNYYQLYPQSIDLRYLSFDSVMKMLMLNVTKNSSYTYGDTMSTLIEETDLFTAMLLLLDAFACAFLIPLVRSGVMVILFLLGFMAILRALFATNETKLKITCGQLCSNILFMIDTVCYFFGFSLLMNVSSSDEVLTIGTVSTNVGNPIWMLLIVLLWSASYVAILCVHIEFCVQHANDMGFEAYAQLFSALGDRIGGFFGGFGSAIKDGINDIRTGTDSGSSSSSSDSSTKQMVGINGTGAKDPAQTNTNVNGTTTNINVNKDVSTEKEEVNLDLSNSAAYAASGQTDDIGDTQETTDSINEQIEVGRDMQ
jgi:hypothetical protein